MKNYIKKCRGGKIADQAAETNNSCVRLNCKITVFILKPRQKFQLVILFLLVLTSTIYTQSANNYIEHPIAEDFNGALYSNTGDLDSDGDIDIVGVAFWGNEVAWWENSQNIFTKHSLTTTLYGASRAFIYDLDSDGDMDILAAGSPIGTSGKIIWWENDGNNNFAEQLIYFGYSGKVYPVDLDSDGDVDIVGGSFNSNYEGYDNVSWWENDGNQNFTKYLIGYGYTRVTTVLAKDVDGDGDNDILCAMWGDSDLIWFENCLPDTFQSHLVASNFTDGHGLDGADLDGDSYFDFVGASIYLNTLAWWQNTGKNDYTRFDITTSFAGASYVHVVDFDLDNDIDIFCVSEPTHSIAWWENMGFNTFEYHLVTDTFQQAISATIADIDNDGDLDVIGAAFSGNKISWWENTTDLGVSSVEQKPQTFELFQNYPNPFNPITKIEYQLPHDANVSIKIYTVLGEEIKTLVNQYQSTGYNSITWDGTDDNGNSVSSGIYFYQIYIDDRNHIRNRKKMLYLK